MSVRSIFGRLIALVTAYSIAFAAPLAYAADLEGKGRDADALRMLHAPQAEPGALLNGLISELRRLLAVKQTTDDAEAARLAGVKATAAMNHARRRAARFKPDELRRLLAGAIQALRQARGRVDELTAAEWYVANAKRIVGARR